MNSSTLRRLAADHASLRKADLPPNYLFPISTQTTEDDLTQLAILLTGPRGTPYERGVWKLHLKIPHDYPKHPPKAAFRTKLWHPNVEESTGNVCVETLKRDWDSKLTLRDVLVTISCLLIQPNPDSALNATAGQLLQEDYDTFARQAKLMTSIHATVPGHLRDAVTAAQQRGEEAVEDKLDRVHKESSAAGSSKTSRIQSNAMRHTPSILQASFSGLDVSDDNSDDESDASKENDPTLSPDPVVVAPTSPRRSILGKRPLSDLPTPVESDDEEDSRPNITSSERNIAANIPSTSFFNVPLKVDQANTQSRLAERSHGVNLSNRASIESNPRSISGQTAVAPNFGFEHQSSDVSEPATKRVCPSNVGGLGREGKENMTEEQAEGQEDSEAAMRNDATGSSKVTCSVSFPSTQTISCPGVDVIKRAASTPARGALPAKRAKGPRVGLRRL